VLVGEKKPEGKPRATLYIAIAVIVIILVAIGAYLLTIPRAPPPTARKITFYTWWAGLERFAIDALISNFTAKTGIPVEKTAVPGGAGVNAKFAIIALIMAGKPPEAFQVHCGPEIISYFSAAPHGADDFVELTSAAQEIGLYNTPVGQVCLLNGKMYSTPVNLHRANLIFMNKDILDKYGLKPPTTLDELRAVCRTLSDKGVPCLVEGGADQFTVFHTWEQIFLALAGPQKFVMFMYGTLPPDDPTLKTATDIFLELAKTFPSDWMSLDWTACVDRVVTGKAFAHVDGDWAVGLIYNVYPNVKMCSIDSITPDCKVIVAPFPGTQGIYNMVIDAVGVPKGPSQDLGLQFAKYFASKEGQSIFNPLKGSIAAYPDIPTNIYPTDIQKWEVKEYSTSKAQVFSLTHGALFSDVFAKLLGDCVVLAQTGRTDLWYNTLSSALATERKEWESSGLFIGTREKPFAGYLPPWVKG